jgi:hypothetical protein
MTDPQPTVPPAGWYTDPSGQPGQRWWDGASWTQSTQPTPVPQPVAPQQSYPSQQSYAAHQDYSAQQAFPAQQPYAAAQPYEAQATYSAQPSSAAQNPFGTPNPFGSAVAPATTGAYGTQQPYGAQQPYGSQQPYGYNQSYDGHSDVNPSTPGIWLIAFWPLWLIVTNVASVLVGGLDSTAARYADGTLAQRGLAVLALLFFVWFAYRDSRELKARGLDRPFGWGWGFIPLVYLIGRTVVAKSRTGRGLAPLFVCIGIAVASPVLAVAALFAVVLVVGAT